MYFCSLTIRIVRSAWYTNSIDELVVNEHNIYIIHVLLKCLYVHTTAHRLKSRIRDERRRKTQKEKKNEQLKHMRVGNG